MPAQTNLALIVDTNPFSRTIKDRGVPTAGPEELLIRVEAAGLNPVDARIGKMQIPMWADMPTVPGAEASGVIVAIGSEVKGLKVGDRVCVASIVVNLYFQQSYVSFRSAFGTAGQKLDVSSYQQYSLAHSTIVTKVACSRGPSIISDERPAICSCLRIFLSKKAPLSL
jgi:NADPH:quinone reductase-like Zn-dependent oxidoreductase